MINLLPSLTIFLIKKIIFTPTKSTIKMMKKLLLLAILLLPFTIHAQTNSGLKKTNFILKGGPTFSKVIGDDIRSDFKVGFQAGLISRIPMKSGALDLGIIYNQKGFTESEGQNVKISVNYLTIPVHFIIPTNSGSSNFYVGPEINIFLNNKATIGDVSVTFSEGVTPLDLSFAAGLELIVTSNILIDFGGSFGLIKAYEVEDYSSTQTIGNNISFNAGMKFIIN